MRDRSFQRREKMVGALIMAQLYTSQNTVSGTYSLIGGAVVIVLHFVIKFW